ncbi:hypothetical protein BOSEA31B_11497 [Hyphomicrobiales bacterium]|nr:hypothetical protein BOSEA31B_11497 [Hyphomicrobiales bacterium]CAH1697293.1 hypothetical protein BOSEA1005_10330 [Hyphomicrobiales bacterium]CAI0343799.1 hypothetical protein BO1005MUT1_20001 [Hyphomicrobiales bacterium]
MTWLAFLHLGSLALLLILFDDSHPLHWPD